MGEADVTCFYIGMVQAGEYYIFRGDVWKVVYVRGSEAKIKKPSLFGISDISEIVHKSHLRTKAQGF